MNHNDFSISDIALGNLRHRKRQYILLAAGVLLAIYFAAMSLLFGFGFYTSLRERMINLYGEQDVILFNCGNAPVETLLEDCTLGRLGRAEILAMAMVGDGEGGSFPIAKYDEEAMALTHSRLEEGVFPTEEGQIALAKGALARLRIDAGIGDIITLTLRIPNGEGFLPDTIKRSYALTGILYDQFITLHSANRGYIDGAFGMFSMQERIEPGGRGSVTVYGKFAAGKKESWGHIDTFCSDHDIDRDGVYYTFSDIPSGYDTVYTGVSIVVVGLILVLACCLGIVNAFSTNLDARRRQIGLLRAVGATKRQIKRIFRRETWIIALTATPIGIGLALASVYGVFALLGGDYYFIPNVWVVLGVAAVGIGCIALASGIPLRRAAAVSPMQAVRDVDMARAVKKKAVKSKTQFDVARLTASRANRIYKTRRISIGIMLAAGISLFSVSTVIINEIMNEVVANYSDSYDYRLYKGSTSFGDVLVYGFHAPGLTEGDRRDILSLPLVENATGTKEIRIKILPDTITPYATGDGWQWEYEYLATGPRSNPDTGEPMRWYGDRNETYREGKAQYGYTEDYLNTQCVAVEEDLIERLVPYVYTGEINLDKLRSGEEVLLIAPKRYELYYTPDENGGYGLSMRKQERPGERVVSSQTNDMFRVGDPITLSLLYTDGQSQNDEEGNVIWPVDAVRIDKTAKIGALIDIPIGESPMGYEAYVDFLNVITTIPGFAALGYDVPYKSLLVTLSEEPDPQTEAYLQDSLEEIASRIPGASLTSYLEIARESRQFAFQCVSVALALIILMMAITASMMNNTLSAHIRAGRRGIGTLRAVGVSDRIIFRSYLYQLLYLFAWGGGTGYVVSVVLVVVMRHYNIMGIQNAPTPYWQPLLFIALLFGICFLNVRAWLRGVLRESVIDNIRVL